MDKIFGRIKGLGYLITDENDDSVCLVPNEQFMREVSAGEIQYLTLDESGEIVGNFPEDVVNKVTAYNERIGSTRTVLETYLSGMVEIDSDDFLKNIESGVYIIVTGFKKKNDKFFVEFVGITMNEEDSAQFREAIEMTRCCDVKMYWENLPYRCATFTAMYSEQDNEQLRFVVISEVSKINYDVLENFLNEQVSSAMELVQIKNVTNTLIEWMKKYNKFAAGGDDEDLATFRFRDEVQDAVSDNEHRALITNEDGVTVNLRFRDKAKLKIMKLFG